MRQPAPSPPARHVEIDGRTVRLTNLDKVLWPSVGMTKAQLIDYYLSVAAALLPHLAHRALTLHRFPDGVNGTHWYETRAPAHPPWVQTQRMHTFRPGKNVDAPVIDGLPALVWAANAAAIELHPFLAPIDDLECPTVAVFDLDPGEPADLLDAARTALALRALLDDLGLVSFPKTSGGKGLHVYVPLNPGTPYTKTKTFARALAAHLVAHERDVVDVMPRARRAGKVFVDWSQNDAGKSTIAPYSLRGLWYPTVSMPVTWSEIEAAVEAKRARTLVFLVHDVARRLDEHGDLFAPVLDVHQALPT